MNDDSPTYFSASKSTTSCLDLCLTKSFGFSISSSWSTGDNVGSDHIITSLELKTKFHSEVKKIKKTNWEAVRKDLEACNPIIRCKDEEEIEQSINELSDTIRMTVEKNTKSKTILTRNCIALSAETSELIKFRRKLMKLRNGWEAANKPTAVIRRTINNLNREVEKLIKRDVESKTATKIETIYNEKDASKSWRKLKELEPDIGKSKEEGCGNGIKDAHGNIQKDDKQLARIHGERLADAYSYPSDAKFDENFRQKIEAEVETIPNNITNFNNISEVIKHSSPKDFIENDKIGRNPRPQNHYE